VKMYALLDTDNLLEAQAYGFFPLESTNNKPVQVFFEKPEFKASHESNTLIVKFCLHPEMLCLLVGNKGDCNAVSLSTAQKKFSPGSNDLNIYMPCLPAALAEKITFFSEASKTSHESSFKRLIQRPDLQIHSDVENFSNKPEPSELSTVSECPAHPAYTPSLTLERLATSITAAIAFARTEINPGVSAQINVGSIKLIQQLAEMRLDSSSHEMAVADFKQVMMFALTFGKKEKLDVKGFSKRKLVPFSNAELLSEFLSEFALAPRKQTEDCQIRQTIKNQPESENECQAFTFVLREVLKRHGKPDIEFIQRTLSKAEQEIEYMHECETKIALQQISSNTSHPRQDLEEFYLKHGKLPALQALALIFWSWSDKPGSLVERRLNDLNASHEVRQLAMTFLAATCGSDQIPARYRETLTWSVWYKRAWNLLLQKQPDSKYDEQDQSSLKFSDAIPEPTKSGIRFRFPIIGIPEASISLTFTEERLALHRKMLVLLDSEFEKCSACLNQLLVTIGPRHDDILPRALQNKLFVDLKFSSSKQIIINESNVISAENIPINKVEVTYKWLDSAQIASNLLRSNQLSLVLKKLTDEEIRTLNSAVDALMR
jgi:hypothetical protein